MIEFKDITVKAKKEAGFSGSYEIAPLPKGYGNTLANSFRRVLLSSIEGAGVTSIKFAGIEHEYSTIEGIKEDVLEIILNVKSLRFNMSESEPQICKIEINGKKNVTGKDIKTTGSVEVMNKDVKIAELTDASASLNVEFVVEKGYGYRNAAETNRSKMGYIPLDTDFSPVVNVNFNVLQTRKGQDTNYDAVLIDITTDGSIAPIDALLQTAKIVQNFAGKVMVALGVPVKEVEQSAEESMKKETPEEVVNTGNEEVLSWKIEDLPISKRSKTGLLSGGYVTVGDLKTISRSDLLTLPGFGNKSLNEVIELLGQYGIEIK